MLTSARLLWISCSAGFLQACYQFSAFSGCRCFTGILQALSCAQTWHPQDWFGNCSGILRAFANFLRSVLQCVCSETQGRLSFWGSFAGLLRASSENRWVHNNMFIRKLKGMYLIFQGCGGLRIAFICEQNWHPQDCFGSLNSVIILNSFWLSFAGLLRAFLKMYGFIEICLLGNSRACI